MATSAQTNPESRFDRDSWIVASVAILYLVVSVGLLLIGARFPSDGWLYDDLSDDRGMLAMNNIRGDASPLQKGDIVISVEAQTTRFPVISNVWRTGGTAHYTVLRNNHTLEFNVDLKPQPPEYWRHLFANDLIGNTNSFASLAVSLFVFVRRPRNLGARALLLVSSMWLGMTFVLSNNALASHFSPPIYYYLLWFWKLSWAWWLMPALITFVLVFPLRKGPMRRHARLTLLILYALAVALSLPALFDMMRIYLTTLGVLVVVFLATTFVTTLHTLHTNHDPMVRAQLGWMALGLILSNGIGLVWFQLSVWLPDSTLVDVLNVFAGILQIAFPVCAAIAILRYRLFDIDVIINRALVYGALTAAVVGLYVLVVGYLGSVLEGQYNLLVSLLATGLVAVLFQPLRGWLQRGVNRLMYGRRDEPLAVLAQLGTRLEGTLVPEEILPALVTTVTQALKLPFAAIALRVGDDFTVQAESGSAAAIAEEFPLIYQGETIGQLRVARRSQGEEFNSADRMLLTNIARQAGPVAHSVRLTAALRHSRQQLVNAREEERRRLRRDLHDGLGPQLASQTLTLEAISKLSEREPEKARGLLAHLRSHSQEAIQDIRRLVYGLRPPALDELGLVEALREGLNQNPPADLRVEIKTAPHPLPALPAAIEVAVYRIAQEAITNVIRHAQAHHCAVLISAHDHHLDLSISDDGRGYLAGSHHGVGLSSMRERAEELGGTIRFENKPAGGACVRVSLPLPGEDQ